MTTRLSAQHWSLPRLCPLRLAGAPRGLVSDCALAVAADRLGGTLDDLTDGADRPAENVRQIPPEDPDYVRLMGLRSDAACANRQMISSTCDVLVPRRPQATL